jgi:phage gpG-like protein
MDVVIDTKTVVQIDTAAVEDAVEKAAYRNFNHAAASLRKEAQASIKKAAEIPPPGKPPRTKKGLLRRAIRYSANEDGAVIGPAASIAGTVGAAHEFGGRYKKGIFDKRPFMEPALQASLSRFAGSWQGSVGG